MPQGSHWPTAPHTAADPALRALPRCGVIAVRPVPPLQTRETCDFLADRGKACLIATNAKLANREVQHAMRKNYYQDLSVDYSKPNAVDAEASAKLIAMAEKFAAMKEALLPEVNEQYTREQIERENKEWWPTHCEALRQGRGDILTSEYRADLVYFCQDGPYYGLDEQKDREKHWWALLAQPGVTMTWPIVMFHQEFVHFEWACMDDVTNETIAKGTVCWVRRGHKGGCHFKSEQLTFYRDVFAPESLLSRISA